MTEGINGTLDPSAIPSNPPDTLYHYTDANGLIGILQTGKIWATNVFYLNDSAEVAYGLQALDASLYTISQMPGKQGIDDEIFDLLLAAGRWCSEATRAKLQCFVACFCNDHGDRLSQWRGYGGDGGGFSIGFRYADLIKRGHQVWPVRYTVNEHVALIHARVLDAAATAAASAEVDALQRLEIVKQKFTEIIIASLFMKSQGFAEEKEWRMASTRPPKAALLTAHSSDLGKAREE